MNKQILSHLAALTVNIMYGLNFVIAKEVMPVFMKPTAVILVRVLGAIPLFWLLGLTYREKIALKDVPVMILCGLTGVAANQLLFFIGLDLSSPVNAAILMTSNPIMVMGIAALMIGEKVTPLKITGIVMGAAGAVILILASRGKADLSGDALLGNIFIVINALCFAIYMVISKPLMKKYRPITVIKWVFTFGLGFVLPFGISDIQEVGWADMPSGIWWRVAFIVLGVTFLAYLFNIFALKYLPASTVSFYIYLQPLVAAIHSWWLGVDEITILTVACSLLIFGGVYLVNKPTGNRELRNSS